MRSTGWTQSRPAPRNSRTCTFATSGWPRLSWLRGARPIVTDSPSRSSPNVGPSPYESSTRRREPSADGIASATKEEVPRPLRFGHARHHEAEIDEPGVARRADERLDHAPGHAPIDLHREARGLGAVSY